MASAPFSVPPGGTAEVLLPYQAPSRGSLAVEIDDPSGYPADDARYAVLDPRGRTRVLIVGDGAQAGFYLTRALQAAEPQDGFEVRLRSPRTLGSMPPEEFSSHRTVLLLSTRSLDRRARELLVSFVREGGGLLVTAAAEVEPSVLAAVMEWPDFSAIEQDAAPAVLAATDLRHPIFRPFGALAANLGQVRFSRAWLVRGDGWDVAARFTDGSAALLERREGKGRVLLFASDLDRRWNDFPLHSTFVPFAVEAVRHLAAADPRRREYVVASAPAGAPPQPGAYVLPSDGRLVAVNVDVREGGTSRMNADEFLGMVQKTERQPSAPVQRRAQQIEAQQGLWRYGVLFMLAALVTESIVGRGR